MKTLPCALALAVTVGWLYVSPHMAAAGREIFSLDGQWQVADSVSENDVPSVFPSQGPVPGLANLARPVFANVDAFVSREQLVNRIRSKAAPEEWLTQYWAGKIDQDRNYFWYKKTFHAPGKPRAVAILKINKAQFGTAVWLNGQKIGDYAGCFTASYYHLENGLRWGEENSIVIRIGAHPAVLPDTYPTGSDFEKIKWTPGIYDSVSVFYADNPVVESIQVAPRIQTGEVFIQTRIKNWSAHGVSATLEQIVRSRRGGHFGGGAADQVVELGPLMEKVITQTVKLAEPHLWTPEDPFLYTLQTATGGDSVSTSFGMREFRFDAASGRAHLNGKVYYLRGSNITLHRFFEDPLCGDLPWKESWVRTLLGDIPKKMHWNYFRFCIGPVPDKWFEICDEEGLLIQNEFFVWTGGPGWYKGYSRTHDPEEMIRQYKDWMRDNWNHPSVAVWDANNETRDDIFGSKIIPAVRALDLSNRPWENSYNAPAAPDDPVEDHPYLMSSGRAGKLTFSMTDLEKMDGKPRSSGPSKTNPRLINEYGWLWLNRDGTPTVLTENLYPQLMGGMNTTARERLDLYAYLLSAKTEFWRAHRNYAGIIHFVYLTCSYPGVYTADHFQDVRRLKLDPAFADYMGEAFKPLGVYLNFFQPVLQSGTTENFKVMLVNDEPKPVSGKLLLGLENEQGVCIAHSEQPFSVVEQGQASLEIPLSISKASGKCILRARAMTPGDKHGTSSRRWVKVEGGSSS